MRDNVNEGEDVGGRRGVLIGGTSGILDVHVQMYRTNGMQTQFSGDSRQDKEYHLYRRLG